MKIAAVVVGLFVAALAYLSYKGLMDVKWVAMENVTRSALTNASGQVVQALNNTATQFAAHPSAVYASGLPILAMFGFVPELMMGFKKGLQGIEDEVHGSLRQADAAAPSQPAPRPPQRIAATAPKFEDPSPNSQPGV